MPRCLGPLALGLLLLGLPGSFLTRSAGAAEEEAPAALSLETLLLPEKQVRFEGPPPPTNFWLAGTPARLAVRRSDQPWILLDPDSGEERPWELPGELVERIAALPGATEEAARGALDRRLPQLASGSLASGVDPRRFVLPLAGGLVLTGSEVATEWITRDAKSWNDPTLSPDGSQLAYTMGNDLYVLRLDSGEVQRLTTDGSPTQLNGRLDWTYQEEIYGRGNFRGFWWSPDGRRIALLRIDLSRVALYTLAQSRTPRGGTLVERYPKAGDPIPRAELWVAELADASLVRIHAAEPDDGAALVVRVTWRPDGRRLTYQLQNRVQTWLELRQTDLESRLTERLLREEGPAWVEILGEPHFLPGGDFLWLSDLPRGRRHLWHLSADGARRTPVTSGSWDVASLEAIAPDGTHVLLSGDRLQGGTVGRHLYRVPLRAASASTDASVEALTETPGWHSVRVAPDARWMVDTHSRLTEPPSAWLASLEGDRREPLERAPTTRPIDSLSLIEPEWVELSTRDGIPLPAYLIPPRGRGGAQRHPVLVYTYGGPRAAVAVDRWSGRAFLYHQLLAAEGIGVMVVDNRSSAGRGIADTWSIHRRMGEVEAADLEDAVQWLREQPWVDADRVALRGWSFGGYLTAYAMTRSTAFRAGIAGGSPTDWRNYDAFYTERYMDTPAANPEGYRSTSVLEAADSLHGRLLLVHGELDDNVHPANTLQLAAALQKAAKPFDLMIYPDAGHGVVDPHQVYHLYRTMTEFLRRELMGVLPEPPTSPALQESSAR